MAGEIVRGDRRGGEESTEKNKRCSKFFFPRLSR